MRKFNKYEFFCIKCMIHDTFFVGGGSWSPDCCPECRGCECIAWEHMSFIQKRKAQDLFEKMWQEIRVTA